MSGVKIQMRVKSGPLKAGDVVEVDAEKADYLVENGHATKVKGDTKKAATTQSKD